MTEEVRLVYILGAGHCGSTLLNLLLNGHSKMIGMSELCQLEDYLSDGNPRQLSKESTFWTKVQNCYEKSHDRDFEDIDVHFESFRQILSWPKEKVDKWTADNVQLVKCLAEESESPLVVDSSKWHHRLYLLLQQNEIPIKVIHLVRDGRAIMNSYYRKYDSFRVGFRRWFSPSIAAIYLKQLTPSENWIRIHYEELAQSPEDELRTICDFLSLKFEYHMLDYRESDYYGIGGNRMRHDTTSTIELDESWKDELSRRNRLLFEAFGAWLNMYYGYLPFN